MAILAYDPLSAAPGFFKRPIDTHGKLRYLYGKFVVAVAGDIGSTFNFGKLPPGAVRVYFPACWALCSAWGAARTMSIGHAAYRSKQDAAALNDGIEPASVNAFANALDMSAAPAARIAWQLATMKYDLYSLVGVDVIGTLAGGIVPAAGTFEFWMAYVYE